MHSLFLEPVTCFLGKKNCLKDPFLSPNVDIEFDLIEEPEILSIKKCIINAHGAVTAVES